MIASLGMYDFGPLVEANDRFWALIRDALRARNIAAPETLTRGDAAYWPAWQSPDLLLSQTCGYPFRKPLFGKVGYVGTLDYGVEGSPPGYYRSVFVARKDDPRETLAEFDGARFAYNDDLSQSGWAGPQNHAISLGIRLPPALQSGAHRLSAQAIVEGRADIAALDAITFAHMQSCDPVVSQLKVLGPTDPTPGLPLITSLGQDPAPIFASVSEALAALAPADRATLRLKGLVHIPLVDYLAVPNPPSPEQFAATS
jgi:ABC-type phosphate/phosphonate transport system substrate-binding protein